MKRAISLILLVILTINSTGCNRNETPKEDNVYTQVKEVGYAALYEPYITNHDYQYAYEVSFSDEEGNAIDDLGYNKKVYLPQENFYPYDISLLEVYRLDAEGETKVKSRYIYDRFMLEVETDRAGTFVVKGIENKSTQVGDLKYIGMLSDKGLASLDDAKRKITEKEFVTLLNGALGSAVDSVDLSLGKGKNLTRISATKILAAVLTEVYGVEILQADTSFAPKDLNEIPKELRGAAKLMVDRLIIKLKLNAFKPKETVTVAEACEMVYKSVFMTKTQPKQQYELSESGKIERVTSNGVTSFAEVPKMRKSENFTMTANGVPVFVEDLFEESLVRFAVDGKTEIEITCADNVMGAIVSPRTLGIAATYGENKVKFTIDGPQKLFIQFGNMDRIILCAEAMEENPPAPDGENVINVLSLGADNTGNTSATKIIQAAIDEGSKSGKTVYIPDGTYITGLLKIKPNTDLYLEPSGMLFAGEDIKNYVNNADGISGCHIEIYNADNVKIHGYGIIRHNGTQIRSIGLETDMWSELNAKKQVLIRGAILYNCKNVNIDGIYSMDSALWNTTVIQCQDSEIKNYKAINNVANPFNDGIDPEWCYNLTVDNCLTYTNDDALCVKAGTYYPFDFDIDTKVGNILFTNNIVFTFASGMVLGCDIESRSIENVTYEGNCIISADRPISVRNHDWSVLKNITWKDNVIERVYADPRNEGGHTMLVEIENYNEDMKTNVDTETAKCIDFTIDGLKSLIEPQSPCEIRGENENKVVKNFIIKGLNIAGKAITKENFRASIDEYSEVIFR